MGGIANEDGTLAPRGTRVNLARHKVGLSTCAGCHTGETNTAFTMIKPRRYNVISRLAAFMTGTRSAHDPVVAGETHFYDDLAAREGVMRNLLEVSRTALPKKIRLSRVDFPANLKPGNKAAEIIVLGGSATHWALSLVAGPGADHNAAFSIAGNALLVQGNALPPGPLSVRIRATAIDAAGNTDASGVFIEKTQSLWSRKAGVSVKLSSRAFEATTTTETPALLTPRPFRIH